jgi:hypothetical protein
VPHFLRLALFGLCAVLTAPAYADIAIGQVLPLTGAGAETGRELSVGARVYVDQVNAAGGIAGQKIIYLARDDAGLPKQALARAGELIARDKVFGLLEGATPANVEALVSSGMLRQHSVPMLGLAGGVGSPVAMDGARRAGLVEIVAPQDYVAPVLEEFRAALRKYGPAGATYSSAALQGYIAAKILAGALSTLPPAATHADFYALIQNLSPELARHLMISAYAPE